MGVPVVRRALRGVAAGGGVSRDRMALLIQDLVQERTGVTPSYALCLQAWRASTHQEGETREQRAERVAEGISGRPRRGVEVGHG